MKKLFIIFAVMASLSVNAQSKKDTLKTPQIPADSVKILSKTDLENFVKYLRDNTSVNYYEGLRPAEAIQQLYFWFLKSLIPEKKNK